MARWQYPILSEPVFVPAGETITLDKWFQPWPEPTRRKSQHASQAAGPVDHVSIWPNQRTPDLGTYYWFQPWAEPVRRKRTLNVGGEFGPTPIPHPDFGWYQPWEGPSRQKAVRFLGAESAPVFVPSAAENVTLDKWFLQWEYPVRPKRRPIPPSVFDDVNIWPPQGAEVVTLDKWFVPWPDPVRKIRPRQTAGAVDHVSIWPNQRTPDIGTHYWLAPWPDPVRRKLYRQYDQLVTPVFVGETISLDKWFLAWLEPTRRKLYRQSAGEAGVVFVPAPSLSTWFLPTNQPLFAKLRRAFLQAGLLDDVNNWPEFLTVIRGSFQLVGESEAQNFRAESEPLSLSGEQEPQNLHGEQEATDLEGEKESQDLEGDIN